MPARFYPKAIPQGDVKRNTKRYCLRPAQLESALDSTTLSLPYHLTPVSGRLRINLYNFHHRSTLLAQIAP